MPNWCFNTLMVTGPTQDVGSLHVVVDDRGTPNRVVRTALSLQRIDPMPAELGQSENLNGEPVCDWFTWCIAHWGTKWKVRADLVDDLDVGGTRTLTFAFDAARTPPIIAINTLAERFPTCEFVLQFSEPACDFEGEYVWSSGNLRSRREGKYTRQYDGGVARGGGKQRTTSPLAQTHEPSLSRGGGMLPAKRASLSDSLK